jgi:hypothetical protein
MEERLNRNPLPTSIRYLFSRFFIDFLALFPLLTWKGKGTTEHKLNLSFLAEKKNEEFRMFKEEFYIPGFSS